MAKFEWSLRPLTVCMTIVLGLNLDIDKKPSIAIRFLVPVLGVFVILCSLAINGPCAFQLNQKSQSFGSDLGEDYESAFQVVNIDTNSLLRIVSYVCRFGFFLAAPLVHLTFMANVLLTRNWRDLIETLRQIQKEAKLSKEFHLKCRRQCFVFIFLLFLVSIIDRIYLNRV